MNFEQSYLALTDPIQFHPETQTSDRMHRVFGPSQYTLHKVIGWYIGSILKSAPYNIQEIGAVRKYMVFAVLLMLKAKDKSPSKDFMPRMIQEIAFSTVTEVQDINHLVAFITRIPEDKLRDFCRLMDKQSPEQLRSVLITEGIIAQ
jgi:hypothetical protein